MPRPFESAASELVDEALHPVEQLELLEEKVRDLEAVGDADAVIECRIKQLALQRLLVYLHDFPLVPLIRAEILLAEAYGAGKYLKQAQEHLGRAHEVTSTGIYDDAQCQRLQVDLLAAEGYVQLSGGQLGSAQNAFQEAARMCREVYGEHDKRGARISEMLGQLHMQRGHYQKATDLYSAAWEVYEYLEGQSSERTIRLSLRIAEVMHLEGKKDEAIAMQKDEVKRLQSLNFPALAVDAATRLARWQEAVGKDEEALAVLQSAEKIAAEKLGAEDAKSIEVKRDIALLHLKLGHHDVALQYLTDVHEFEKRMHGMQSVAVGRTLKALGTVHMVRQNYVDAEQCLVQALRIFEADMPHNSALVKDINSKLSRIAAAMRHMEQ